MFSYCIMKNHRTNFNCDGSNIDSPCWIKSKRATINPINKKGNECVQYVVTGALNHKK